MGNGGIIVMMAFQGMVELSTILYFVHFGLLDYHSYEAYIRRKEDWNNRLSAVEENTENFQWLATAGIVVFSQFLAPQFMSVIRDDPPALSKALGVQNIVLWLGLTFTFWLNLMPTESAFVSIASLVAGALALRGGSQRAQQSRAINLVLFFGLSVVLIFARTFTNHQIWNSFQSLSILLVLFISHAAYLLSCAIHGSRDGAVVSMHSATIGCVLAVLFGFIEQINRDIAIKMACVWSWYAFLIYILTPKEKKHSA